MSRLALIQAEFRARQQEEKENKLIAMLEEQQERVLRAARTYSGNSHGTNSISSSSSTTSSLGSTGGGGKVRQMFEERRSHNLAPPTRPPIYAKSNSFRRPPVVPKTRPLEPVPRIPPPKRGLPVYKSRGASLERQNEPSAVENALRRTRSQYHVNGNLNVKETRTLQLPKHGRYNKSVTSLTDSNRNNLYDRNAYSNESLLDHEYEYPKFDDEMKSSSPDEYIEPLMRHDSKLSRKSAPVESGTDMVDLGRRPLSNIDRLRAQFESSNADNDDDYAELRAQQLEIARMKQFERDEEIRRQQLEARRRQDELDLGALRKREDQIRVLREKEAQMRRQQEDIKRQQEEIKKQQENRRKQMEHEAELRRRKEAEEKEKKKSQDESKRREEELMKKIREQEEELKRLQAASKTTPVPETSHAPAPRVPPRTRLSPVKRISPARSLSTEESDDAKSTASDGKPVLPPKPTSASSSRGSSATSSTGSAASRRSAMSTRNDLVPCAVCGRNFAPDRVEKHQSVCSKTTKKKRKVFDMTKMRVKGTEAETYILKKTKLENSKTFKGKPKPGLNLPEVQPVEQIEPKPEEKKADWRKKHENFLETIRAAKVMQKHLAAGGKLSDLPPPPPSDTSDYISCPHCERRFSPGAADRHIPKCEGIRSNKKKR